MILRVDESAAEEVSVADGVSVLIVQNRALEDLLFNRALIGLPFRHTCLLASRLFLRHIADELASRDDVSELLLLSKGLAYQLGEAYAEEVGRNLPTNMVGAIRVGVEVDNACWESMSASLARSARLDR